eukprot:scaffold1934_cov444-Prasinococcus_capsulatus_cf.AAC.3
MDWVNNTAATPHPSAFHRTPLGILTVLSAVRGQCPVEHEALQPYTGGRCRCLGRELQGTCKHRRSIRHPQQKKQTQTLDTEKGDAAGRNRCASRTSSCAGGSVGTRYIQQGGRKCVYAEQDQTSNKQTIGPTGKIKSTAKTHKSQPTLHTCTALARGSQQADIDGCFVLSQIASQSGMWSQDLHPLSPGEPSITHVAIRHVPHTKRLLRAFTALNLYRALGG